MSKVRLQNPVVHTPRLREYMISSHILRKKLADLSVILPMGMLDWSYYHTDMEGWGKVLEDLVFKSSLYQADRFDCDNYALKAMTLCAERYGLNTLGFVIGNMPQGRHAFNVLYHGDGFLLWEPNEGFPFSGSTFEIGDFGYQPEWVLM